MGNCGSWSVPSSTGVNLTIYVQLFLTQETGSPSTKCVWYLLQLHVRNIPAIMNSFLRRFTFEIANSPAPSPPSSFASMTLLYATPPHRESAVRDYSTTADDRTGEPNQQGPDPPHWHVVIGDCAPGPLLIVSESCRCGLLRGYGGLLFEFQGAGRGWGLRRGRIAVEKTASTGWFGVETVRAAAVELLQGVGGAGCSST